MDVKFIGLGQNIYEGAKPQMYFALRIQNLDREQFQTMQKNATQLGNIDVDKCTYLVDYKTMKFIKKDKIDFYAINTKKNKRFKHTLGYEKSFACNVWHFEQFNKENAWV